MSTGMKARRIAMGLTQQNVAAAVGLTITAVQKIETGQRKPSYEVMCKMEDFFGCTHRQLFTTNDLIRKDA